MASGRRTAAAVRWCAVNGPGHYAEAERAFDFAAGELERAVARRRDTNWNLIQATLAAAQVHATLALAAATAPVEGDIEAWEKVTAHDDHDR